MAESALTDAGKQPAPERVERTRESAGEEPAARLQRAVAPSFQGGRIDPRRLTPQAILALQRTVGNRAVNILLQRTSRTAFTAQSYLPTVRSASEQTSLLIQRVKRPGEDGDEDSDDDPESDTEQPPSKKSMLDHTPGMETEGAAQVLGQLPPLGPQGPNLWQMLPANVRGSIMGFASASANPGTLSGLARASKQAHQDVNAFIPFRAAALLGTHNRKLAKDKSLISAVGGYLKCGGADTEVQATLARAQTPTKCFYQLTCMTIERKGTQAIAATTGASNWFEVRESQTLIQAIVNLIKSGDLDCATILSILNKINKPELVGEIASLFGMFAGLTTSVITPIINKIIGEFSSPRPGLARVMLQRVKECSQNPVNTPVVIRILADIPTLAKCNTCLELLRDAPGVQLPDILWITDTWSIKNPDQANWIPAAQLLVGKVGHPNAVARLVLQHLEPAHYQAAFDYCVQGANIDVAFRRLQALVGANKYPVPNQAADQVADAAQANAHQFTLQEAQALVNGATGNCLYHIANNEADAKQMAISRPHKGGGATGKTNSVITSGSAGMAAALLSVLNAHAALLGQVRKINEESGVMRLALPGNQKIYYSTNGTSVEAQPWTEIEVIVVRKGPGPADFLVKHLQPNGN